MVAYLHAQSFVLLYQICIGNSNSIKITNMHTQYMFILSFILVAHTHTHTHTHTHVHSQTRTVDTMLIFEAYDIM